MKRKNRNETAHNQQPPSPKHSYKKRKKMKKKNRKKKKKPIKLYHHKNLRVNPLLNLFYEALYEALQLHKPYHENPLSDQPIDFFDDRPDDNNGKDPWAPDSDDDDDDADDDDDDDDNDDDDDDHNDDDDDDEGDDNDDDDDEGDGGDDHPNEGDDETPYLDDRPSDEFLPDRPFDIPPNMPEDIISNMEAYTKWLQPNILTNTYYAGRQHTKKMGKGFIAKAQMAAKLTQAFWKQVKDKYNEIFKSDAEIAVEQTLKIFEEKAHWYLKDIIEKGEYDFHLQQIILEDFADRLFNKHYMDFQGSIMGDPEYLDLWNKTVTTLQKTMNNTHYEQHLQKVYEETKLDLVKFFEGKTEDEIINSIYSQLMTYDTHVKFHQYEKLLNKGKLELAFEEIIADLLRSPGENRPPLREHLTINVAQLMASYFELYESLPEDVWNVKHPDAQKLQQFKENCGTTIDVLDKMLDKYKKRPAGTQIGEPSGTFTPKGKTPVKPGTPSGRPKLNTPIRPKPLFEDLPEGGHPTEHGYTPVKTKLPEAKDYFDFTKEHGELNDFIDQSTKYTEELGHTLAAIKEANIESNREWNKKKLSKMEHSTPHTQIKLSEELIDTPGGTKEKVSKQLFGEFKGDMETLDSAHKQLFDEFKGDVETLDDLLRQAQKNVATKVEQHAKAPEKNPITKQTMEKLFNRDKDPTVIKLEKELKDMDRLLSKIEEFYSKLHEYHHDPNPIQKQYLLHQLDILKNTVQIKMPNESSKAWSSPFNVAKKVNKWKSQLLKKKNKLLKWKKVYLKELHDIKSHKKLFSDLLLDENYHNTWLEDVHSESPIDKGPLIDIGDFELVQPEDTFTNDAPQKEDNDKNKDDKGKEEEKEPELDEDNGKKPILADNGDEDDFDIIEGDPDDPLFGDNHEEIEPLLSTRPTATGNPNDPKHPRDMTPEELASYLQKKKENTIIVEELINKYANIMDENIWEELVDLLTRPEELSNEEMALLSDDLHQALQHPDVENGLTDLFFKHIGSSAISLTKEAGVGLLRGLWDFILGSCDPVNVAIMYAQYTVEYNSANVEKPITYWDSNEHKYKTTWELNEEHGKTHDVLQKIGYYKFMNMYAKHKWLYTLLFGLAAPAVLTVASATVAPTGAEILSTIPTAFYWATNAKESDKETFLADEKAAGVYDQETAQLFDRTPFVATVQNADPNKNTEMQGQIMMVDKDKYDPYTNQYAYQGSTSFLGDPLNTYTYFNTHLNKDKYIWSIDSQGHLMYYGNHTKPPLGDDLEGWTDTIVTTHPGQDPANQLTIQTHHHHPSYNATNTIEDYWTTSRPLRPDEMPHGYIPGLNTFSVNNNAYLALATAHVTGDNLNQYFDQLNAMDILAQPALFANRTPYYFTIKSYDPYRNEWDYIAYPFFHTKSDKQFNIANLYADIITNVIMPIYVTSEPGGPNDSHADDDTEITTGGPGFQHDEEEDKGKKPLIPIGHSRKKRSASVSKRKYKKRK